MAQCSECGYDLSMEEVVCPKCGCPVPQINHSLLQLGKNTEAEETISNCASLILKVGNILNIIFLVINLIGAVILGIVMTEEGGSDGWMFGIPTGLGVAIFSILIFILVKFLIKLIWATIMLFVNISTTLKRIEINQENHGTC